MKHEKFRRIVGNTWKNFTLMVQRAQIKNKVMCFLDLNHDVATKSDYPTRESHVVALRQKGGVRIFSQVFVRDYLLYV